MSSVPPRAHELEEFFQRYRTQATPALRTESCTADEMRSMDTALLQPSPASSSSSTDISNQASPDLMMPSAGHRSTSSLLPVGRQESDGIPVLNDSQDYLDPQLRTPTPSAAAVRVTSNTRPTVISISPSAVGALDVSGSKRPAASLLQYTEREIVSKKLKGEAKDSFLKWSKTSPEEREAATGAILFSIAAQLKAAGGSIGAANSQGSTHWVIPERVHKNINKYAIRLLLSPSLPEYDGEGLVKTLMDIIEKKGWGLPANLRKQDEEKWDIIEGCIRHQLTQRKSEIKKILLSSMGIEDGRAQAPSNASVSEATATASASSQVSEASGSVLHIYDLCKTLTTSLGKKSGINTNLTVTIEMCARVAFLRSRARTFNGHPYITDPKTGKKKNMSSRFYAFVDHGLDAFRKEGNNVPQTIHDLFVANLREDQVLYPARRSSMHPDVFTALSGVNPTDAQDVVDQFAATGQVDVFEQNQ